MDRLDLSHIVRLFTDDARRVGNVLDFAGGGEVDGAAADTAFGIDRALHIPGETSVMTSTETSGPGTGVLFTRNSSAFAPALREPLMHMPPLICVDTGQHYLALLNDPSIPVSAVPHIFGRILDDELFFRLQVTTPLPQMGEAVRNASSLWWNAHARGILGASLGDPLPDGSGVWTRELVEEGVKQIRCVLTMVAALSSPYRVTRPPNAPTTTCTARLMLCRDPSVVYLGLLLNTSYRVLSDKVAQGMSVVQVIASGWGGTPSLRQLVARVWHQYLSAKRHLLDLCGARDAPSLDTSAEPDVDDEPLYWSIPMDPTTIVSRAAFDEGSDTTSERPLHLEEVARVCLDSMREATDDAVRSLWWARCRLLSVQLLSPKHRSVVLASPAASFYGDVWEGADLFGRILADQCPLRASLGPADLARGDVDAALTLVDRLYATLVGTIADVAHLWHFAQTCGLSIATCVPGADESGLWNTLHASLPYNPRFAREGFRHYSDFWQYALLIDEHTTRVASMDPRGKGYPLVVQLMELLQRRPEYYPGPIIRTLGMSIRKDLTLSALSAGLIKTLVGCLRYYLPRLALPSSDDGVETSDSAMNWAAEVEKYVLSHSEGNSKGGPPLPPGVEDVPMDGLTLKEYCTVYICIETLHSCVSQTVHPSADPVRFLLAPDETTGFTLINLLHALARQRRYGSLAARTLCLFGACAHHNVRDIVPALVERGILKTILTIASLPLTSSEDGVANHLVTSSARLPYAEERQGVLVEDGRLNEILPKLALPTVIQALTVHNMTHRFFTKYAFWISSVLNCMESTTDTRFDSVAPEASESTHSEAVEFSDPVSGKRYRSRGTVRQQRQMLRYRYGSLREEQCRQGLPSTAKDLVAIVSAIPDLGSHWAIAVEQMGRKLQSKVALYEHHLSPAWAVAESTLNSYMHFARLVMAADAVCMRTERRTRVLSSDDSHIALMSCATEQAMMLLYRILMRALWWWPHFDDLPTPQKPSLEVTAEGYFKHVEAVAVVRCLNGRILGTLLTSTPPSVRVYFMNAFTQLVSGVWEQMGMRTHTLGPATAALLVQITEMLLAQNRLLPTLADAQPLEDFRARIFHHLIGIFYRLWEPTPSGWAKAVSQPLLCGLRPLVPVSSEEEPEVMCVPINDHTDGDDDVRPLQRGPATLLDEPLVDAIRNFVDEDGLLQTPFTTTLQRHYDTLVPSHTEAATVVVAAAAEGSTTESTGHEEATSASAAVAQEVKDEGSMLSKPIDPVGQFRTKLKGLLFSRPSKGRLRSGTSYGSSLMRSDAEQNVVPIIPRNLIYDAWFDLNEVTREVMEAVGGGSPSTLTPEQGERTGLQSVALRTVDFARLQCVAIRLTIVENTCMVKRARHQMGVDHHQIVEYFRDIVRDLEILALLVFGCKAKTTGQAMEGGDRQCSPSDPSPSPPPSVPLTALEAEVKGRVLQAVVQIVFSLLRIPENNYNFNNTSSRMRWIQQAIPLLCFIFGTWPQLRDVPPLPHLHVTALALMADAGKDLFMKTKIHGSVQHMVINDHGFPFSWADVSSADETTETEEQPRRAVGRSETESTRLTRHLSSVRGLGPPQLPQLATAYARPSTALERYNAFQDLADRPRVLRNLGPEVLRLLGVDTTRESELDDILYSSHGRTNPERHDDLAGTAVTDRQKQLWDNVFRWICETCCGHYFDLSLLSPKGRRTLRRSTGRLLWAFWTNLPEGARAFVLPRMVREVILDPLRNYHMLEYISVFLTQQQSVPMTEALAATVFPRAMAERMWATIDTVCADGTRTEEAARLQRKSMLAHLYNFLTAFSNLRLTRPQSGMKECASFSAPHSFCWLGHHCALAHPMPPRVTLRRTSSATASHQRGNRMFPSQRQSLEYILQMLESFGYHTQLLQTLSSSFNCEDELGDEGDEMAMGPHMSLRRHPALSPLLPSVPQQVSNLEQSSVDDAVAETGFPLHALASYTAEHHPHGGLGQSVQPSSAPAGSAASHRRRRRDRWRYHLSNPQEMSDLACIFMEEYSILDRHFIPRVFEAILDELADTRGDGPLPTDVSSVASEERCVLKDWRAEDCRVMVQERSLARLTALLLTQLLTASHIHGESRLSKAFTTEPASFSRLCAYLLQDDVFHGTNATPLTTLRELIEDVGPHMAEAYRRMTDMVRDCITTRRGARLTDEQYRHFLQLPHSDEKTTMTVCPVIVPEAGGRRKKHGKLIDVHRYVISVSQLLVYLEGMLQQCPHVVSRLLRQHCIMRWVKGPLREGQPAGNPWLGLWLRPLGKAEMERMDASSGLMVTRGASGHDAMRGGERNPLERIIASAMVAVHAGRLKHRYASSILNGFIQHPLFFSAIQSPTLRIPIPDGLTGLVCMGGDKRRAQVSSTPDAVVTSIHESCQSLKDSSDGVRTTRSLGSDDEQSPPLIPIPAHLAIALHFQEDHHRFPSVFLNALSLCSPARTVSDIFSLLGAAIQRLTSRSQQGETSLPPHDGPRLAKATPEAGEGGATSSSASTGAFHQMVCIVLHGVCRSIVETGHSNGASRLCEELLRQGGLTLVYRILRLGCCVTERDAKTMLLLLRRLLLASTEFNAPHSGLDGVESNEDAGELVPSGVDDRAYSLTGESITRLSERLLMHGRDPHGEAEQSNTFTYVLHTDMGVQRVDVHMEGDGGTEMDVGGLLSNERAALHNGEGDPADTAHVNLTTLPSHSPLSRNISPETASNEEGDETTDEEDEDDEDDESEEPGDEEGEDTDGILSTMNIFLSNAGELNPSEASAEDFSGHSSMDAIPVNFRFLPPHRLMEQDDSHMAFYQGRGIRRSASRLLSVPTLQSELSTAFAYIIRDVGPVTDDNVVVTESVGRALATDEEARQSWPSTTAVGPSHTPAAPVAPPGPFPAPATVGDVASRFPRWYQPSWLEGDDEHTPNDQIAARPSVPSLMPDSPELAEAEEEMTRLMGRPSSAGTPPDAEDQPGDDPPASPTSHQGDLPLSVENSEPRSAPDAVPAQENHPVVASLPEEAVGRGEAPPWEGSVDPLFLMELAPDMRAEILFECMNIIRGTVSHERHGQSTCVMESFLDQLPEDIQREVLRVEERWAQVMGQPVGGGDATETPGNSELYVMLLSVDDDVRRDILLTCDLNDLQRYPEYFREAQQLREAANADAPPPPHATSPQRLPADHPWRRLGRLPFFVPRNEMASPQPRGAVPPEDERSQGLPTTAMFEEYLRSGSFLNEIQQRRQERLQQERYTMVRTPDPPRLVSSSSSLLPVHTMRPSLSLPPDVLRLCMGLLALQVQNPDPPSSPRRFLSSREVPTVASQLVSLLRVLCTDVRTTAGVLSELIYTMMGKPGTRSPAEDTRDSVPGVHAGPLVINSATHRTKLVSVGWRCLVDVVRHAHHAILAFVSLPDCCTSSATVKPVDAALDTEEAELLQHNLPARLLSVVLANLDVRAYQDEAIRWLTQLNDSLQRLETPPTALRLEDPLQFVSLSDHVILHPRHAHRLRWQDVKKLPSGATLCGVCGLQAGNDDSMFPCFQCDLCSFAICRGCASIQITAEEQQLRIRRWAYHTVSTPELLPTVLSLLRHPRCTPAFASGLVEFIRRGLTESAMRDANCIHASSAIAVAEATIIELARATTVEIRDCRRVFHAAVQRIIARLETSDGLLGTAPAVVAPATRVTSSVLTPSLPEHLPITMEEAVQMLSHMHLPLTSCDQALQLFTIYGDMHRTEPREVALMWHAAQMYLFDITTIIQHLPDHLLVPLPPAVLFFVRTFCSYHMGVARRAEQSASASTFGSRASFAGDRTETERFLADSTVAPSVVSNRAMREMEGERNPDDANAMRPDEEERERRRLPRTVRKFLEVNRAIVNTLLHWDKDLLHESFGFLLSEPSLIDFTFKLNEFRRCVDVRRGPRVCLVVDRQSCLQDSFKCLKHVHSFNGPLHIHFQGEEGADAGGLTREWFHILSKEMVNESYALFVHSREGLTYQPNPLSSVNANHLEYFRFVGIVVGLAIANGVPLDVHFTRALYRHMIGVQPVFKDLESVDPELFASLGWLLRNDAADLDLSFAVNFECFGEVKEVELLPNGRDKPVTNANKLQYVRLLCEFHMTRRIEEQLVEFLKGFYLVVPRSHLQCFSELELELVICGMPDIDIEDLRSHTVYEGYTATSPQIRWFWEVMGSMTKEDRANFLQFATGASKVPQGGFANLEGVGGGSQRMTISRWETSLELLPQAHTCFNKIDLPEYPTAEVLREKLMLAINYGSMGFTMA